MTELAICCSREAYLKVLVVVWVNAEAGHKAIHHEVQVCVLAACPPPERLGRVEQQSLIKKV